MIVIEDVRLFEDKIYVWMVCQGEKGVVEFRCNNNNKNKKLSK